MMKNFVRSICFLTAVNMTLGVAAGSIALEPQTAKAVSRTDDIADSDNSFGMYGSNSVGNYIADAFQEQQNNNEESDGQSSGFYVEDIVFERETGDIYVKSTQPEDCRVILWFKEDGSSAIVKRAEAEVKAGDAVITKLNVDASDLPDYFVITADLYKNNKVLGKSHICEKYTRSMQEIYAAKATDFEPERVVNFDDDISTNFIVISEDAVIAESDGVKNKLLSADYENGVYVFENPDEIISSLEADDLFYIKPSEDDMIAVSVGEIEVKDGKAVITENPEAKDDIYEFVKIECSTDLTDAVLEDGTIDENVEFTGTEDCEFEGENFYSITNPGSNDGKVTTSFTFKIGNVPVGDALYLGGSFSINSSLVFNFYKKRGYISVSLMNEYTITSKATLSTATTPDPNADTPVKEVDMDKAKWNNLKGYSFGKYIVPVGGGIIAVSLEPKFVFKPEFNAEVSVQYETKTKNGYSYSTDKPVETIEDKQSKNMSITGKVEGKLTVGFELAVGICDAPTGGNVLEITFPLFAGLVITGKYSPISIIHNEDGDVDGEYYDRLKTIGMTYSVNEHTLDKFHFCNLCIEGTIDFVLSLSYKINILKKIKFLNLSFTTEIGKLTYRIADFHISFPDGFGWGKCENVAYPVEVTITESLDGGTPVPLKDATLTVNRENTFTSDANGKIKFYAMDGLLKFEVAPKGKSTAFAKGYTVSENPRKINICLRSTSYGTDSDGNIIKDYSSETAGDDPLPTTTTIVTTFAENNETIYLAPAEDTLTCGMLGDNIAYQLFEDGFLYVYGYGDMYDLNDYDDRDYYVYFRDRVTEVFIENVDDENGITSIGNCAFGKLPNLRLVEMPDTIRRIGDFAFAYDTYLEMINVPDGVEYIGKSAFEYCPALEDVNVPRNAKYFGEKAFYNCSGVTSAVIPYAEEIGESAFRGCVNLSEVTLGNNLTTIGSYAFRGCNLLTEFTVPDSVRIMGPGMLQECFSIEEVTIPFASTSIDYVTGENCGDCSQYSQVSDIFFSSDYSYANNMLGYTIKKINVTGGDCVPVNAFNRMNTIEEVNLPESVRYIKNYAFRQCYNLKKVRFPSQLEWVGTYAFAECSSLESAELPNAEYIEECAFDKCSSLNNVVFGNKLKTVYSGAFGQCTALTHIEFPDSLELIDQNALYGCTALYSLVLPFASTSRSCVFTDNQDYYSGWYYNSQISDIFYSDSGVTNTNLKASNYALRSITITGGKRIPAHAFDGLSLLTEIIIPDDIEYVGYAAFRNCNNAKNFVIPTTITEVCDYAFENCQGIERIELNNAVSIGNCAFESCSGVKSISLAYGLKSIGASAFSGCSKITELVIPDSVDSMGTSMLRNCTSLRTLTIPFASTYREYTNLPNGNYSDYTQVSDLFISDSSYYRSESYDNYSIRTIIVTGGECIPNYAFSRMNMLTSVAIPDSIEYIGYEAFDRCWNLVDFVFPSQLKTIGSRAFYSCSALPSVNLSGVTEIGSEAFSDCSSLAEITLGSNLQTIGYSAFSSCSSLTELVVPSSVEQMGTSMLYGCYKLKTLTIPYAAVTAQVGRGGVDTQSVNSYEQVSDLFYSTSMNDAASDLRDGSYAISKIIITDTTIIPPYTFSGMTSLKEVVIPNNVTYIGYEAFKGCTGLSTFTFPTKSQYVIDSYAFNGCYSLAGAVDITGATAINDSAFSGCEKITGIKLGSGLKSVGDNAFSYCRSLAELVIPDSVDSIGLSVLCGCYALRELTLPYASTYRTLADQIENNYHTYSQISDIFYSTSDFDLSPYFGGSDYGIRKITVTGGKYIPPYAFYNMNMLTEIVIPDDIEIIGDNAFKNCSGINSFSFPTKSEYRIESYAFSGCSSLKAANLSNAEYIGTSAFSGCHALAEMQLGNKLAYIGESAFSYCSALKKLTVPDSVKFMGTSMLYGCYDLAELTIPFAGAGDSECAEFGKSAGNYQQVSDLISSSSDSTASAYVNNHKIRKITVTGGEIIPDYAFAGMSGIVTVIISDSIRSIGGDAFRGCYNLEGFVLPSGVESIGYDAFTGCSDTLVYDIQNPDCVFAEGGIFPNGATVYGFEGSTAETYVNAYGSGRNIKFIAYKNAEITEEPADVVAFEENTKVKVTFGAQGNNLKYQWFVKGAGDDEFTKSSVTSSSYSFSVTQAEHGMQLYCVITDRYGNTARTKTVSVTLATPLAITKQPASLSVSNAGDPAKVEVKATGDELTYLWYYKDVNQTKFSKLSIANKSSYSFSVTEARDGRQMYCIVTDKYCRTVRSDTVTLRIKKYAAIEVQPVDVEVAAAGDTATLNVTASGDGITYLWYYKNPGQTKFTASTTKTASYSLPITAARNGRQMYCVITDKYGKSVQTNTVTMTVKAKDLKIVKQPVDVEVAKSGDKATISVTADGDGLTYLWYYKNPGVSKFTASTSKSASYSLEITDARSGRQMYCVITDKYGNSVQTNTVTMTVKPKALKITSQPVDAVVANAGDIATISVKAEGDGLKYLWYFKNPGVSKFTAANSAKSASYSLDITAARSGRQMYCVITDKYGNSVKTNTVVMRINRSLEITSQPTDAVVANAGDTATLKIAAQGDGLTYLWYYKNPGASSFSASTITTPEYNLPITAARNGRQMYCVVTDAYGNTVKSETVTMSIAAKELKITSQPKNVAVAKAGDTATLKVTATGDGLKYVWYYKNPGASKFTASTSTSSTYSLEITSARNGREMYCVITDKYGNSVRTDTVKMTIA